MKAVRDNEAVHFEALYPPLDTWFEVRAYPSPAGLAVYFTDVSELHSFREKQRLLESRTASLVEQRSKLIELNRSKDEFISLASHQLRTPATGVKQYIAMLLEGYEGALKPRQRQLLKVAFESNERQLRIINDLLKVAKADAGRLELVPEPCNLVELLYDVIREHLSVFHDRKQTIVFNDPPESIVAEADTKLIRMVLENIIDNASKYTPHGKAISIEIGEEKGHIVVSVTDQGVGISLKDRKQLFQKFSRIDNSLSTLVGGSGLGLYWAKKVMDLHGGRILIKSRQGHGSTFTIKIPLKPQPAAIAETD
jgi:signal transduction histidine kinase